MFLAEVESKEVDTRFVVGCALFLMAVILGSLIISFFEPCPVTRTFITLGLVCTLVVSTMFWVDPDAKVSRWALPITLCN